MLYKGKIVDFDQPVVMAIVNVTSDSFFDGGSFLEESTLIKKVSRELSYGAKMIDLGGCSSRPGAERVSLEEELFRVVWATKILKREFPDITLSIDTYRCKVAQKVSEIWGEIIVNDISAGEADENMIDFVASEGFPYIAMHYQKDDLNCDITTSVMRFFSSKCEMFERKGIKDVILDVGFGFDKRVDENYKLVKDFECFNLLERPLLVGVSRKSMIHKVLNCTPADALNGTTSLNTLLLLKGANILRVHDSKEACEVVKIVEKIKNCD